MQVVIVFGLLYHEPLQYNEYHYPGWAEGIGWTLAMSSILMIPLFAIIQLINTPGTLKEVCAVLRFKSQTYKSEHIILYVLNCY